MVETTENGIKEIFNRLGNIFTFSYIISFVSWNHNVFLAILFHNSEANNYETTINYINKQLNPWYYSTIVPLLFAILYIILLPNFKKWNILLLLKINNIYEYSILNLENKKPLTQEASDKLLIEIKNTNQINKDLIQEIENNKVLNTISESNILGKYKIICGNDVDMLDFLDIESVLYRNVKYSCYLFKIENTFTSFSLFNNRNEGKYDLNTPDFIFYLPIKKVEIGKKLGVVFENNQISSAFLLKKIDKDNYKKIHIDNFFKI
ncbi:MAG: hypothetical protein RLZZ175_2751 [Bacteroidota bacterium]|jgi:hypothetical protein